MLNDFRSELHVSSCPKCGTRLMCGKIIVTGLHKCSKCNRHWVIQIERNKVTKTEYGMRHTVAAVELGTSP